MDFIRRLSAFPVRWTRSVVSRRRVLDAVRSVVAAALIAISAALAVVEKTPLLRATDRRILDTSEIRQFVHASNDYAWSSVRSEEYFRYLGDGFVRLVPLRMLQWAAKRIFGPHLDVYDFEIFGGGKADIIELED